MLSISTEKIALTLFANNIGNSNLIVDKFLSRNQLSFEINVNNINIKIRLNRESIFINFLQ